MYPQPKGLIYVLKPPSKLKELFLPNVIISIISTYRRTKILEKILATSKGRKDSPLATDAPPTADCFKCDKTKCDLCKKIKVLVRSTFSNAQTCSKLFSGQRLSFYLVLRERCNLQYAAWFYHYRIPKLRMQTRQSLMCNWMFALLNFAFQFDLH